MGTRGYLNYLLYRRGKLGEEWTISRTDPFAAAARVPCRAKRIASEREGIFMREAAG